MGVLLAAACVTRLCDQSSPIGHLLPAACWYGFFTVLPNFMPIRWTFRRRPHWPDLRHTRGQLARLLLRRRRRFRRRTRTIVTVLVLLAAAVAACTGGPLPRWIALGRLHALVPQLKFTADSARLTPQGTLLISKLRGEIVGPLAAKLPEAARQVLTSESVEIEADWPGWKIWQARLAAVRVERPVVRLSQNAEGALNIGAIMADSRVPEADLGGGAFSPPVIELVEAAVEVGEHDDVVGQSVGAYRQLSRLEVSGWVLPKSRDRDVFAIAVHQTGGDVIGLSGKPIALDGLWLPQNREALVTISGVDLSRLTAEKVPAGFRQLWEAMRLRGRITQTTMRSSPQGLEVELALESVQLRVPIAAARPDLAVSRFPVMEDVSGMLRLVQASASAGGRSGVEASLTGTLEDLSATVIFSSQGLSLDSPYTAQIVARGFKLEKEPRLLWLTPDAVRDQLGEFSGPTATVDALITIARQQPTPERPSGVRISGSLSFVDGTAAYDMFPYPMLDLSGTVSFDDDQVTIRGIRGRGASGASVLIQGTINETAAMRIDVTLADIPFDDEARRTLDASPASPLVRELFSVQAAGLLAGAGLLPIGFVSGGVIDSVQVHIERPSFDVLQFTRVIEIQFGEARLLPDAFPLPLSGRDLTLAMRDGKVTLRARDMAGPSGGSVDIDAILDLGPAMFSGGGIGKVLPTVVVKARTMPVDAALLFALDAVASVAVPSGPAGHGASPLTPGRVLGQLGFQGRVECDVRVDPTGPEDKPDGLGYEVNVGFENATASPRVITATSVTPIGLAITELSGMLHITPGVIGVKYLGGEIRVGGSGSGAGVLEVASVDHGSVAASDGAFSMSGMFTLGQHASGRPGAAAAKPAGGADRVGIEADFSVTRLNLAAPFEELLRPFDESIAGAIAVIRGGNVISGTVDLDVQAYTLTAEEAVESGGLGNRVSVVVRGLDAARLKLAEGVLRVDQDTGSVAVTAIVRPGEAGAAASVPAATLLMSDLALELSFTPNDLLGVPLSSELVGRLSGGGAVQLSMAGAGKVASGEQAAVRVSRVLDQTGLSLRDGRFGSPLVRSLARKFGGAGLADAIEGADLRGEFVASASMYSGEDAAAPEASITIAPKWLSLRRTAQDFAKVKPVAVGGTGSGGGGSGGAGSGGAASSKGSGAAGTLTELPASLDVLLPRVEGSVTVSASGGSIDKLTLDGGQWEITLDGIWHQKPDDREPAGGPLWTLETQIDGEAKDMVPSLRAMLPAGTQEMLYDLKLAAPGGVTLKNGRLVVTWPVAVPEVAGVIAGPTPTGVRFVGPFAFGELRASPGLEISNCSGRLDITVDQPMSDAPSLLQLVLSEATLRVAGLPITNASGLAESGAIPGEFLLRSVEGECLGGRITGSAVLRPEIVRPVLLGLAGLSELPRLAIDGQTGSDAGRAFAATVSFGGIRLASAAAALASGRTSAATRTNAAGGTSVAGGAALTSGSESSDDETHSRLALGSESGSPIVEPGSNARVDGRLSITGQVGSTPSLAGDGAVRVSGGKVVNIPVLVALLRLSNLQIPVSQELDYFQTEFTLSGNTVTFNRLAALSDSVAVLGEGTLTLPDLKLDVTLASRGREVRIPLLTRLLESVRDEIISARIGGTLGSPTLSAESLSGTRGLFSTSQRNGSGTRMSAEERLREIERQARRSVTTGAVLRPEPE